ncbi:MAG TPA: Ig-like domain-containing protein, partial [Terriglobia bacterium]|nr:Ig-like domain-containing protein [Terriglobia bacterium]
ISSGNGNISLSGAIGATQALAALTIDTSAGLTLPGIVVSGGVDVDSAANGSATVVAGNLAADTITINAGGNFTNSALIAATAGISIHATGALTNSAGATIAGSGTLTGTTFSNSGTLRPGGSGAAGALTIVANTNLATTGVLEMELLGAGAGQYDTLEISGPVTVQGMLNAQLAGGFAPASGDRFRFMAFNSHTGFFGATNLPADFIVDQTDPTDFELVFVPNDPPVANTDAYSTDENTPLIVPAPGVLANDADADGDAVTAVLVTGPSHGTLVLNANGSFTYTPNSGFAGVDSFTYRANDGTDPSSLSTVTITVDPLSTIFGLVYEDTNNNGQVDFGEQAIANVTLHLTGIDNLGQAVSLTTTTDVDGVYVFTGLRRGTYSVIEEQPSGYSDGIDSLGTVNGVVTGNNSVNDALSGIVITQPGSVADNYNFGERANGGAQQSGQTANVGFWQNNTGRALLQSLHGGPDSTALGNWLATNFSNMWGANAGASDLTGKTNVEVADFYSRSFARTKKEMIQAGLGGPVKMEAQVLAVALAVYVTDLDLAGTTATSYGFHVDSFGIGARTFNVGNNGEVFDLADGTHARIFDLLLAANRHAHNGILYDEDHDGDSNNSLEVLFRTAANEVFSAINQNGSV